MPIRIYPSSLDGEPLETHKTDRSMTLLAWLTANVEGFVYSGEPKFDIYVNGEFVPMELWNSAVFRPNDDVDIKVNFKGLGAIIIAAVSAVLAVAAYLMVRKIKMPDMNRATPKELGDADISANIPRMGDVVPEVIGAPIRYPDYLTPPRKWFSGPHEQWVEVLLCIGVGEYNIDLSDVYIGDTRATLLGENFSCEFYPPNADLSNVKAAEWWHSPSEVGFTSFGSAGLELSYSEDVLPEWDATEFSVLDQFITGNTPVPVEWTTGLNTVVTVSYPMRFEAGWISSVMLDALKVVAGDDLEIRGPLNAGFWRVLDVELPNENHSDTLYFIGSGTTDGEAIQNIGRKNLIYQITQISGNSLRLLPAGIDTWAGFPVGAHDPWVVIAPFDDTTAWQGWFQAVPTGRKANAFELDFQFPQGIGKYDGNNVLQEETFGVVFEWRYVGSIEVHTTHADITGKSIDPSGYSFNVELPEDGRIEVRCRQFPAPRGGDFLDKIQWSGLKARIVPAPTVYDGVTVMAARLRSGDRISMSAEDKINVRARRKLPTVEDINEIEETRNIAPFLLYMFDQIGYTRDLIDMSTLNELHRIWDLREDTFDTVISSSSTAKTLANHALQVGFSELTIKDGLISFVRDVKRSGLPSRIYSPQQYTTPLIESTKLNQLDEIDGVDAEYVDFATGKNEVVQFRLEGDEGRRVQRVTLVGVSARNKARQLAARIRRTAAYRRTEYSGETEMQALNSHYFDYIGLQDGFPEYGQSAFVIGYENNEVMLSEPIEPDAEVIIFVRKDGTSSQPLQILSKAEQSVTVASLPFAPVLLGSAVEPTIVYLGKQNSFMFEALMVSVEPKASGKTAFKAVNYDERVYLDDEPDPLPTAWIEGMGDLVLWLDSYENSTIIYQNNRVITMLDKSAAENDAHQPVARQRPAMSDAIYTPRALKITKTGD